MPEIFTPDETAPTPLAKHAPVKKHVPPVQETTTEAVIPIVPQTPHFHPFASFCEHPKGVRFENQDADEFILLFLRRHFITNVPWLFTVALLIIIPLLVVYLAELSTTASPFPFVPSQYFLILVLFYYLIVFGYALTSFMTWFYNISIITNQRIVDIDFSDIIYHNVAVTKVDLVEDVDYTQSGAIRSLFNYGDVLVQTASKIANFEFLAVPKPADVVAVIQQFIGGKKGDNE